MPSRQIKKIFIEVVIIVLGSVVSSIILDRSGILKPHEKLSVSQSLNGNGSVQAMGSNINISVGKVEANQSKPEDVISVTPKDIADNWNKFPNEIQAQDNFDKFYKGKKIIWEGNVTSLISHEDKSVTVFLNYGIPSESLLIGTGFAASFQSEYFPSLSVLKRGTKLKVTGTIENFSLLNVDVIGESFEIVD